MVVGVCEVACFNPVPAYRTAGGDVVMVERGDIHATLTLACGRCVGCRIERARQWTVRVMHEAQCYEDNCFVTLTYDDANVPCDGSLRYSDFQRFFKRLRRKLPGRVIRFYMCGEYGDQFGRPHYHAAIFNLAFRDDRYCWRDFGSGNISYRSPTLEALWPFGASSIGDLTSQSAAYVARYAMKKIYGDMAAEHYKVVDRDTGEVTWKVPEFTHMSLRPGIGAEWFRRYQCDVFPHDRVVLHGKESKPPRYYDQLFKRVDRDALEGIKESREREARLRWPDSTPERLLVREAVASARLSFFKRELK